MPGPSREQVSFGAMEAGCEWVLGMSGGCPRGGGRRGRRSGLLCPAILIAAQLSLTAMTANCQRGEKFQEEEPGGGGLDGGRAGAAQEEEGVCFGAECAGARPMYGAGGGKRGNNDGSGLVVSAGPDELEDHVRLYNVVVVSFCDTHAAKCTLLDGEMAKASSLGGRASYAFVDIVQHPAAANIYGIDELPTIRLFVRGRCGPVLLLKT